MERNVKAFIPESVRAMLRAVRERSGSQARAWAAGGKRLDICAAQVALWLHLSKQRPPIDKTCMELGGGWVLSHAIVMHLLGAKRIIATDLVRHARPQTLRIALHKSVASSIRDVLSPFGDHSVIRSRLDNLLAISHFDFAALEALGISYVSPVDVAHSSLGTPVDLVYSNSVLEHVPCDSVQRLLSNVVRDLRPGGAMINCIHLEDHQDIDNDPFGFLAVRESEYPSSAQTMRGNRLRCSSWQSIFRSLPDTQSEFFYEWTRQDRPLPNHIDSSIAHVGADDLRTSHLGVVTRKTA